MNKNRPATSKRLRAASGLGHSKNQVKKVITNPAPKRPVQKFYDGGGFGGGCEGLWIGREGLATWTDDLFEHR